MTLSYRPIDFDSRQDCEALARWNNDPTIKFLFNRFLDEATTGLVFTPDYFAQDGRPSTDKHARFLVLLDGEPIGQATYELESQKLITTAPNTAWIALAIGQEDCRGLGLGTQVLLDLENLAMGAGAEHLEIGVFEYNTHALAFFARHGYIEFQRLPDRAWFSGKLWPEVRLLKPCS